jgi:UDP-N-acetylglucosamine transferase subunit ALG13
MRIFVTVGAQMPFDRLVAGVDAWAADRPEHRVRAQIGDGGPPRHLSWTRFLPPAELDRALDEADAIVGHAGTGTLFAALERGKPVLVMPRRAALRETRNDHQIATAERFAHLAGVRVAWDERELPAKLDALPHARGGPRVERESRGPLVEAIAAFIARR